MAYVKTKPDAGKSPQLDAPTMQGNFAAWATGISANHVAMNTIDQGNHTNVIIENSSGDPGVTSTYDVLFAKTVGSQPQLFVQIPKFLPTQYDFATGPFFPMQLTQSTVNTAGPVYQSFLPGGYYVYFGTTTNIAVPITVSPSPSSIIIAISQGTSVPIFASTTTILSATQFQINSTATGVYSFAWMAIGAQ